MDQSDAGIAGIFSRWTNQTQETRVYSHDGPIRRSSESHSRASVRLLENSVTHCTHIVDGTKRLGHVPVYQKLSSLLV
eukprot:733913-Prorocentrum_minimum.AAC.1